MEYNRHGMRWRWWWLMVAWSVVGLAVPTWAYEELILNAKEGEVNTQYPAYLVTVPNASGYQSHQAIEYPKQVNDGCYVWHRMLPNTYATGAEMDAVVMWYPTTVSTETALMTFWMACTAVGESLLATSMSAGSTSVNLTGDGTAGKIFQTSATATTSIRFENTCAANEVLSISLCRNLDLAGTSTVRVMSVVLRYPCPDEGACS